MKHEGTLRTTILPTTTIGGTFLCVSLDAMVHKVLNTLEVHQEDPGPGKTLGPVHINVERIPMVSTKCNALIAVLQHMHHINALIMGSRQFRCDGLHRIAPSYLLLCRFEVIPLQYPLNVLD